MMHGAGIDIVRIHVFDAELDQRRTAVSQRPPRAGFSRGRQNVGERP